ncbi:MAG: hypothetical protein H6730_12675 [Deltaproteobacteria bacterium]|nr:hypothetical protein [Deltaproteobacteria bacterium]
MAQGTTGESVELLELRVPERVPAVFFARPEEGERLDHLAWRYYRDAERFWRICDASDHLDPWDVLEPGEPVAIPPDR